MSAEVIDIWPDRFLRAMRETGDWHASCRAAGMNSGEVANLCLTNIKFDRAMVESLKEFYEEQAIEKREAAIKVAQGRFEQNMAQVIAQIEADFQARHPELKKG